MTKHIRKYLFLALLSLPLIALDQYTKWLVRQNLAIGEFWTPWSWLEPYARIVHWHNTGVAFGMFQNAAVFITILSSLVALAIIYYFPRIPNDDWILRISLGLQFTGAVGNLIDRFSIGYVTDFISLGTFPVFNVADSCITIGTIILILGVIVYEQREKTRRRDQSHSEPSTTDHRSEHFDIR